MQLERIVAQLRALCPSLGGRVAGAAQFKPVQEATALPVPCAFVIPLDDRPEPPTALNAVGQDMTDSFGVIVALDNRADEKGQHACDGVHAIRADIWRALLGWVPGPVNTVNPATDYNGIFYEGGSLLAMDRARLWYQFEFGAHMWIGASDGWEAGALSALPTFGTEDAQGQWVPGSAVNLEVDVGTPIFDPTATYPANPNSDFAQTTVRAPREHGPDGRVEFNLSVP
ncbi:phage tail terminator protein [Xanthomonas albilineans]|uniref:phage tail terminator protein n=1 Tax=Xanthomonas albilineans TaxID=29447 RepID=UPI000697867B|nr:hypothetical protein [Xanthomonas albilineans]